MAVDYHQRETLSEVLRLQVKDDQPPTVAVAHPVEGASYVSGLPIELRANATDDLGVTQVDFSVNGSAIGTDTDGSDGWSVDWDTASTPDGGATVTATAIDTVAQTASDSVNLTVDNIRIRQRTYKMLDLRVFCTCVEF